MKGPMLQHNLRVLRVWRCPECHRTVRTSGNVTSRLCDCRKEETRMVLIEEPRGFDFTDTIAAVREASDADWPDVPEEPELTETDAPAGDRNADASQLDVSTPPTSPSEPADQPITDPYDDFAAGIDDPADTPLESELPQSTSAVSLVAAAPQTTEPPSEPAPPATAAVDSSSSEPTDASTARPAETPDGESPATDKPARRRRRGKRRGKKKKE